MMRRHGGAASENVSLSTSRVELTLPPAQPFLIAFLSLVTRLRLVRVGRQIGSTHPHGLTVLGQDRVDATVSAALSQLEAAFIRADDPHVERYQIASSVGRVLLRQTRERRPRAGSSRRSHLTASDLLAVEPRWQAVGIGEGCTRGLSSLRRLGARTPSRISPSTDTSRRVFRLANDHGERRST